MTKIKEGYKETEIGVIPEEWEVKAIGDIGEFRKGKGIKKDEVLSEGLSCIRYGEIYTTYNYVVKDTKSFISEETAENSMLILKKEIIFAGSGETVEDIGKAVTYLNDKPCYVGGDTIIMKPVTNINSVFLSYYLATNNVTKQKRKLGQGNSVVHIYVDGVKSIKVVIPSEGEQQRIAEILTTTDEHIEKLDKTIEDYQLLKKGMMKKLLTEGIGHTEFNETEIGRIPKEWEVNDIYTFCNILDSKRKPIKSADRENMKGNIPYYGASGIIDYVNGYIFDEDIILLGEDGENLKSRNSPLAFKVSGKCWVNNHAHVLSIKDTSRDDIDFITYSLEKKDYSDIIIGSAQPKITQQDLRKILIARPLHEEQHRIAEVLLELDKRIDQYLQEREDFVLLKEALMEQLLTGKIRVNQ